MRIVAPDEWLAEVEAARADGYGFFDWLGCVDQIGRSDTLRIVLALRRLDPAAAVELWATDLPRDAARLPTIREVFAGAAWHEREAAELFGVEFVGGRPPAAAAQPGVRGHTAAQGPGAGGAYGHELAGREGARRVRGRPARPRAVAGWCRPGCPTRRCGATAIAAEPAADPTAVAAALVAGRARRRP